MNTKTIFALAAIGLVGIFVASSVFAQWDILEGDINGDGVFDELDITYFREALSDPWAFQERTGINIIKVGDFNRDGVFNGLDIPGFRNIMSRSPSRKPPYEPPPYVSPKETSVALQPSQIKEDPALKLAQEDLAKLLNVDVSQIQVKSKEEVNWSDTSLGYPQPGMMYAMVITPGSRIVLSYDGKDYEYHADKNGHIALNPDTKIETPDPYRQGDFNKDGVFNSLDIPGFKKTLSEPPLIRTEQQASPIRTSGDTDLAARKDIENQAIPGAPEGVAIVPDISGLENKEYTVQFADSK